MSTRVGRFARRFITSTQLVARRLAASWALSLALMVGVASLIAVWVSIPLYAESASSRLLSVQVDDAADDGVPFGYLLSYNRLSGGNKTWADFTPLTQLVNDDETSLGSTVRARQQLTTTIQFDLLTSGTATDEEQPLDNAAFVSLSSFDQLADIVQGRLPVATASDTTVEVAIDQVFAANNAISVGDDLVMVNPRADPADRPQQVFVSVVGIWRPPPGGGPLGTTASDPTLRFLTNGSMTNALVVSQSTMRDVLDPLTPRTLANGQWLILLESATVTTDRIDDLLATAADLSREVNDRLIGARVLVTPETSLEGFQDDVAELDRGLSLFSLPLLGLVLAVLGLMASLRWQRSGTEVSLLRRRGVPASRIIAEAIGEATVLVVGGAALGFVGARFIASVMGRTQTFLRFGDTGDLGLVMNTRSWRALVIAAVLGLVLISAPSLGAMRTRMLSPSGAAAQDRSPWWQRSKLDVVAVGVVGFFTWFLLRRESLQGDLLQDPVVILLPAACSFAAGLLALRLLPWLASMLAGLLQRTDSTAGLLVARRLARVPRSLTTPLLLLVVTVALAIYTGSLARTMDLQLLEAAHHRVGAANSIQSTVDDQLGERFDIDNGRTIRAGQGGSAVDPDALSNIWGVSAASRFAVLPARLESPGSSRAEPVQFTGIDAETFADVAFWRRDYAQLPLAELTNRLRQTPDSVLVQSDVMRSARAKLGDVVTIAVRDQGRVVDVDLVVVGTFDQFPTWVPGRDLPPVVGSLTDFEARSGTSLGRQVFFELNESAGDLAQTRADFSRLGIASRTPQNPDAIIDRAVSVPARQGVFGLLTVSFLLSAALTVAGFVFYAGFGFTQQITELGVLRALGLSMRSLRRIITLDLLFVATTGLGFGIAAGLAMARWLLPALVSTPSLSAPRLLEEIDWHAALGIPLALVAVLALASLVLVLALRRIRLFEAIKVGADQ